MLGKSCPFAKICSKCASFFFIHIAIQRKNAQQTPAFPRRFTHRHCQGGGYPACRLPKKQEREKITAKTLSTVPHFRGKRNHYIDRRQWHITENVHEPVVYRADFRKRLRFLKKVLFVTQRNDV